MRALALAVISLTFVTMIFGSILHVPSQYELIQSAVDAAQEGDTVLLAEGNYEEAVTVPAMGLTIAGPFLFSRDTSDIRLCTWRGIANPSDTLRCLTAQEEGGALPSFVLLGLRFANAVYRLSEHGGVIMATGQGATIAHCQFDSCKAGYGGAISLERSNVQIRNSRFSFCGASRYFSVIEAESSALELDSCAIVNSTNWHDSTDSDELIRVNSGRLLMRNSEIRNCGTINYWYGTKFVAGSGDLNNIEVVNSTFQNNHFENPVGLGRFNLLRIDSCAFQNNLLTGALYQLFQGDSGATIQFVGNTFENFSPVPMLLMHGLFALDTGTDHRITIERNLIHGLHEGHTSFGTIFGDDEGRRTIAHNYIIENSNHSIPFPPAGQVFNMGTGEGELEHNIFIGNQGYAIFQGIDELTSYARHNYFGHETGPHDSVGNPGGQGDTIDFRVIYQPWEVDTSFMSASPPQLPAPPVVNSFIGNVYPNPFNSETTIEFVILQDGLASVKVYDLLGREVATVLDQHMRKGVHIRNWSPHNQPSGIYFARLRDSRGSLSTYKMLLIK